MPVNRAILIDIERLGLDPTKPHSTISSSGRLKSTHNATKVNVVVDETNDNNHKENKLVSEDVKQDVKLSSDVIETVVDNNDDDSPRQPTQDSEVGSETPENEVKTTIQIKKKKSTKK